MFSSGAGYRGADFQPLQVEYDLVQGPKGFQASNLTGPGGALAEAIAVCLVTSRSSFSHVMFT